MTKAELINKIATSANLTKTDTKRVLQSFEQVVTSELANGGDVSLVGFGKFSVAQRAGRIYRHPQTGQDISVPDKNTVKFKVGKFLAEAVL